MKFDCSAAHPQRETNRNVRAKRAENMLEIAGVQGKLDLAKTLAKARGLALNYADRVLRLHPDNPIVRKARLAATSAK
jgi:hypothetical protein